MPTDKKKILITDRFTQEALLMLTQQNFLEVQQCEPDAVYQQDLSQFHGIITRSRTLFGADFFTKAKRLQILITATSGFDHIDLNAARKWGITVMFTPTANVESAAQMTWAHVLNAATKSFAANKQIKAGLWRRELLTGFELSGKTLGIIGLGRIGSKVCDYAHTFGMNVIAYDPYAEEQAFKDNQAERVSFEEVLKKSDVLTLHVPKTKETHHLLNKTQFEFINRGIVIINCSRGSVIHETDLVHALEKEIVSYCGLDVFEKEPLPRDSTLLKFSQVSLTPHLGANTSEAFAKASEQAALKLTRFFLDGSTSDTLPPKAAWYGAQFDEPEASV